MPSYTNLAANHAKVALPPASIIRSPAAIDAWYAALPLASKLQVQALLNQTVANLPAHAKAALNNNILRLQRGAEATPAPGLSGGLGWVGALVTSLATTGLQIGGGLYSQHESLDLQKDLASNQAALTQSIATAQLAAQTAAQKAMIEAQNEAAKLAALSLVEQAKINAAGRTEISTLFVDNAPKLALGVGIVGAVIVGTILVIKKRKR